MLDIRNNSAGYPKYLFRVSRITILDILKMNKCQFRLPYLRPAPPRVSTWNQEILGKTQPFGQYVLDFFRDILIALLCAEITLQTDRIYRIFHCNYNYNYLYCITCETKRDIGRNLSYPLVHNTSLRKPVENMFKLFSSQPSQMTRLQQGAKYCGKIQPSE